MRDDSSSQVDFFLFSRPNEKSDERSSAYVMCTIEWIVMANMCRIQYSLRGPSNNFSLYRRERETEKISPCTSALHERREEIFWAIVSSLFILFSHHLQLGLCTERTCCFSCFAVIYADSYRRLLLNSVFLLVVLYIRAGTLYVCMTMTLCIVVVPLPAYLHAPSENFGAIVGSVIVETTRATSRKA
jgi:hypothetical protein